MNELSIFSANERGGRRNTGSGKAATPAGTRMGVPAVE
jgi:hypothetical protein